MPTRLGNESALEDAKPSQSKVSSISLTQFIINTHLKWEDKIYSMEV